MRTKWALLVGGVILGLALLNGPGLSGDAKKDGGKKVEGKGMLLSHDVFFTLKDNSPAAQQKLIAACQKYLRGHPGEVWFAAGGRVTTLKREVNDQDHDVALHIVFRDLASHDRYQDAPRHKQFIDENKDNWKKVRVFDSWVVR